MTEQVRGRTAPEVRRPSDGPDIAVACRPAAPVTGWRAWFVGPWFYAAMAVLWTVGSVSFALSGRRFAASPAAVTAAIITVRAVHLRRRPERRDRWW